MGESRRASMEDFIRAIGGTNPFQSNRVSSPDDMRVDVEQVHGAKFARLTARIEEVRRGKPATGILLVGPPGTGKSHLLGRLARWAGERSAAFVYLHNLQASPERMPRYVLKATISAAFSARAVTTESSTPFSQLLHAVERHEGALRRSAGDDPVDPEIGAVLDAFMRRLGDPDERDLGEAAMDWLCGDEIDEEQADALCRLAGVAKGRISTRLPDGAAVQRVLIIIARLLALDGKVLVLCFDQIDNLEPDQLRALTIFLHALIDLGQNLVVICAGVTTTIYRLKDQHHIAEAAWDRVAEDTVELQMITSDQARNLIAARTEDFLRPFATLKKLEGARRQDRLFPLTDSWFEELFQEKSLVRPRDVVTWTRDEWERIQHEIEQEGGQKWLAGGRAGTRTKKRNGRGATPAPPLDELVDEVVRVKVEQSRAQRMLHPETLPPDADNLARLTASLLSRCANRREYSLLAVDPDSPSRKGVLPAFDFIVAERCGQDEARTGVVCLPCGHATSTAKALYRVLEYPRQLEHVLVVTDQRREFRRGPKGGEYFDALQQRGQHRFRHIPLTFAEVVELDALTSVLGLARVGDLEIEYPPGVPRPVSESEAAEAMHRLRLFLAHPLLHELLTEDQLAVVYAPESHVFLPDSVIREGITDYLSWRFGASATEVTKKLMEDHPHDDQRAMHHQVIRVADLMHVEGHLQSSPIDEDRYLLWKGGPA